jgi:Zn-dependent protease
MLLLHAPPPTRYDLNFTLARVPVRVHPIFWLVAVVFAFTPANLLLLPLGVAIIFASILVHEMGHALLMQRFGLPSHVVLHGMGGLAIPGSVRWGSGFASIGLGLREENLISFAGPLAGFFLAGIVIALSAIAGATVIPGFALLIVPTVYLVLPFGGEVLNYIVNTLTWVNLVWGFVNLLPVYPLDGGQIARRSLVRLDPVDGGRNSLYLSIGTATVVALAGLLVFRTLWMAFLFGWLAFESWQTLRGRSWS